MENKSFKFLNHTPHNQYLYSLFQLQSLIRQFLDHMEKGGLPKIEVELRISQEGLQGKTFDTVVIDERINKKSD